MVDTGALVHEGWIRLQRAHGITFEARGQFLAYAARVMESVLVDAARRAQSGRRGGDIECVTLDTALGERLCAADEAPLPAVHEALEQLATIDAPLANLVRLRYFAGLDEAELAQTLGITPRMVRRQWEKARAYLVVALKTDSVEAD